MNCKFLIIIFLAFSNPCDAVLTPERAHQLFELILNNPLNSEIQLVGLLPCSKFEALVPAFDDNNSTEPIQNLAPINTELLDLFKYLLKRIKYYPKNYEDFQKQSLENKKLYRVTTTVFCFLVMAKVSLETFERADVKKNKKASILRQLNHLFEKNTDLIPFLKLFPIVLFHCQFIRFLPAIIESSHDVDKPEPHFCHWLSKTALIILNNQSFRNLFSQDPNSERIVFIEKLIRMEVKGRQILNLFVYSCKKISNIDEDQSLYPTPNAIIVFKPTIGLSELQPSAPIIEPPLECSELEKSLTQKTKNRRKKKKPAGKRAPLSTIQPTFLDEEQGMTPSSTSSPSIPEENPWYDPSQEGLLLMRGRDYQGRDAVLKRPHSAPPIGRGMSEPFKFNKTDIIER